MNWSDDDLDLALRDLRDGEVPAAALTLVRARVLAEVRPRRVQWWKWAWLPALAAGLVVVAVIPREQLPVAPPPMIAKAPAAQSLSVPVRPVPPQPKVVAPVEETQFARILTDDPNVVILWAMNTEGESQ